MKQSTHKWLLPGILCMVVLSVFTTTAATKASHGASPESLGTFNYDVRYKNGLINAKVATATITWEESKWQNRPAYHSSALVKAAPVFALFISSDYVAETYFSHSGLAPLYFINPFKYKGKACKYEYVFHEDNKTIESISIDEDDEPEYETFPLDGRTMDLLSLLHFVRFLDLNPDSAPIKMQILMAGKSRDARILYKGIDEEKFPGIPAEKILLEMTEHGLMENGSGNEIYIWRSPGPDRRLLALETELSSGAMFVRLRQE